MPHPDLLSPHHYGRGKGEGASYAEKSWSPTLLSPLLAGELVP